MAVPSSKSDDALLRNLVPLNTLSDDQLGILLDRVSVEKAKKGQYLFREGDTDHQNIYLLHGTIALLSGQKEMDLVSSGTQTARFALAHQLPRKHSAIARTAVTYVRIDSRMLSDMLARSHSASYEVSDIEEPTSGDWMSLLLQSSVFQQIPPANLQRVMMRMEEIGVRAGDVIINQGDEGDYFYLISKGECSVTRTPEAGHAPVELAKLRVGKGFGEEALISNKPRGSTVTMLSDGVLVRLNKQDFIELVNQPLSRTVDYQKACEDVEQGALWLDVRTPEEYEAGHLPGAINLPFFSLRFQASSLTMDRPYIVYGAEVGQSATAAYLLTERGAEVFVLELGWAELEGVSGQARKAGEDGQTNNVIDFNRDTEESATQSRQHEDAQRAEIEKLQRALTDAQSAFDEELNQRKTEIKLLKQALAVAKEHADADEQTSQSVGELERELEQTRSQMAKLESQLAKLQEELEQTRSLSDDFRQQSMELQTQLKESQERHETQDGRLKEEITDLRLQLESAGEAQQQAAEQQTELEKIRSEMAALEKSSEAYRKQAADDLARITAERFELESSLQQMQEQQKAGQAEEQQRLSSLQESLKEAQAALKRSEKDSQKRESELQGKLEQANKAIERLQEAGQKLTAELDAAKQRMSEAGKQASGEKDLLQEQIKALQKELKEQASSSKSQQQEQAKLEKQLHKATEQANELSNQVQALQERRQSLEKELASIRKTGDDAESQFNSAMASLRDDLEQSRSTIDELRQSRQQLEAELQEVGNAQASQEAALQKFEQQLESAHSDAEQARETRIEMEAQLEQERQTSAYLQRSLKTAEEAVEVSDRQFNEADESRKGLEAQLDELQQSVAKLKDGEQALEQSLEQSQQEKAELEKSLTQLKSESTALTEQLAAAQTAGQEEQQQASEAAKALESATQQLAELQAQLDQLVSEREAERQQLQGQLSEAESQSAAQAEALAADLANRQQEVEQLREALSTAQAANEAAADRGELEAAQQALSDSREEITALKREVEGLREVQIEMESQLSEDADAEIQQLRSALEAEEQKRRKAEKLAQKADVMRRERQVQETAIEMLNDDLESLDKEKEQLAVEKEQLAAERNKLVKQLREIRAQYTDLVNENDQLHSEMSGLVGQVSDSSLADDLLSQMEQLRNKAERFEQERDKARGDASRMRREVGELRSVIETYVEQIQDVQALGPDDQAMALRTELDMVRRQAHDDLEQMRQQLQEAESRLTNGSDSRNVDFVADQQAIRQEMVSLQQALNEKDHLLRLSQNQCRSLEDAVEDRDKEVDQLKRKLELLLRKTGGLDDPSLSLNSRNLPDSQQQEETPDGMGGDSDAKKSGIGRLFRKK